MGEENLLHTVNSSYDTEEFSACGSGAKTNRIFHNHNKWARRLQSNSKNVLNFLKTVSGVNACVCLPPWSREDGRRAGICPVAGCGRLAVRPNKCALCNNLFAFQHWKAANVEHFVQATREGQGNVYEVLPPTLHFTMQCCL